MAVRPFFLLLLLLLVSLLLLVRSQAKNNATALYVFGDSLVDCGNNNYLNTGAKANLSPYGVDFPGGITGRATNGFTVPDFLAQWMELPLVPPFLGCNESCGQILTGYNFGSGSSGILPETGTANGENLSMEKQVALFKSAIGTYLQPGFKTQEGLSRHLSDSIFFICSGGNDYALNFMNRTKNKDYYRPTEPEEFAKLLADELGKHLEEIYKQGGRKFVVLGAGTVGCAPDMASKTAGPTQCAEDTNNDVKLYNTELESRIEQLTSTLPNSSFVLGHIFEIIHGIMDNPSQYGFKDARNACVKDNVTCADRDDYLSFDGIHPTEATYEIIAVEVFNGTDFTTPMNVVELIEVPTS